MILLGKERAYSLINQCTFVNKRWIILFFVEYREISEREVLLFTCRNKDAVVRTYGLSPVLDLDLRMHVKVLN